VRHQRIDIAQQLLGLLQGFGDQPRVSFDEGQGALGVEQAQAHLAGDVLEAGDIGEKILHLGVLTPEHRLADRLQPGVDGFQHIGQVIDLVLEQAEQDARRDLRSGRGELDSRRARLAEAERRAGQTSERISALEEAIKRIAAEEGQLGAEQAEARSGLEALAGIAGDEAALAALRREVEAARLRAAEARAVADGIEREEQGRKARLGTGSPPSTRTGPDARKRPASAFRRSPAAVTN